MSCKGGMIGNKNSVYLIDGYMQLSRNLVPAVFGKLMDWIWLNCSLFYRYTLFFG